MFWSFWALIGLLYLFALINLVLTLTLMTMLRIGWGMETIEMLPLLNMVKLYGDIDLGKLYKDDGYFSSFKDSGLRITGRQGGSVHIDVNFGVNRTRRMLSIEPEGVRVTNVKEFNVYDPTDHLPIFSTVLTLTLMTMLRIGWGMETIEMLPLLNMVKLYGDIDLGKLYKDDG
ncbi:uncharacterized protein LOC113471259 [Diaphorina citri]|uniref:Beta-sarcoglycan n=1 Tax=Diaphorina citri TaxID=121845 RepID=A0A3Q0JC98_DIACI|nr:uncharacterized protein LOC113471259 [Diaphorina citri]